MRAKQEPTTLLQRHARSILLFALTALLVQDVFGAHGLLAMHRTQKEIERLRQEISHVNAENRELAEQVRALKTDPKLIERIAREEMGLARPGELIFKVPPQTPTAPNAPKK